MAVTARRARDLPAAPRPRPLRPVPPSRTAGRRAATRSRLRRVPFLVIALMVMAAMVVALTSAQALVAQGSFRISELSETTRRLEVDNDMLRLRLARLSSPDRIAAAARDAGLVYPSRVEVLRVPRGTEG